jgi:hypothetical protein
MFDYQVCNNQKLLVVKLVAIENSPLLSLWQPKKLHHYRFYGDQNKPNFGHP